MITSLRQARGLTRQALGALSSVHPARVGAIENGRVSPPGGSVELLRLAVALGLPLERADELIREFTLECDEDPAALEGPR